MGDRFVFLRAENDVHARVLVVVRSVLSCVVEVQVHLPGVGMGERANLQVLCGVAGYVAATRFVLRILAILGR